MGIALRQVSNLVRAFGEYLRVPKPSGTLWIRAAGVHRAGAPRRRLRVAA